MKLVKILSALAVIAAAGMVAAGCNSPAGTEAAGLAPDSVGGTTADCLVGGNNKEIKVKFEVKNGGIGLWKTWGIIAAGNSGYSVRDGARFANDYTITITVPAAENYLDIYFNSQDVGNVKGYLMARLGIKDAGKYTIVIDFNLAKADVPSFSTKNLRDVLWFFPATQNDKDRFSGWWNKLWNEAFDS